MMMMMIIRMIMNLVKVSIIFRVNNSFGIFSVNVLGRVLFRVQIILSYSHNNPELSSLYTYIIMLHVNGQVPGVLQEGLALPEWWR